MYVHVMQTDARQSNSKQNQHQMQTGRTVRPFRGIAKVPRRQNITDQNSIQLNQGCRRTMNSNETSTRRSPRVGSLPIPDEFLADRLAPDQQRSVELLPGHFTAALDHIHDIHFQPKLPSQFGSFDPESEVLGLPVWLGDILVECFDFTKGAFGLFDGDVV